MTKELTREEMHAYAEREDRFLRRVLASGCHPFAYSGDMDDEGPDGTWGDNRSIHQRTYLPGKW